MTKEEMRKRADAYMESLRGQTPFYDWDVKKAYMDGLIEGEAECEPVQDANGEMLVKLDTKELQELVEKAKDEALAELRKEFGRHPYPDEKPPKEGVYTVIIDNKRRRYFTTRYWDEKIEEYGMWRTDKIVAWIPIPKEGGER